ncbi:unnamed protein product [Rhodiola kirilowii]
MSVANCYSDHQDLNLYKKPSIQKRNNSGELDVFEAANYFSSHDQPSLSTNNKHNKQNFTTNSCKDYQAWKPSGARMSLDLPGRSTSKPRVPEATQTGHFVIKEKISKSNKQPSSPGGRLASFLTSLFTHTASKKKKKLLQEEQRQPRMRRSSISHVDSRSLYSQSKTASGFRTPPPVYKTFFDDSKSLQDHKQRVSPTLPKISNGIERSSTNGLIEKEMVLADKKTEFKFKKVENIFKEVDQLKKAADNNIVKDFEFKKVLQDDDGDQSDTSSDLFELKNYDVSEFRSGLPVYETTNVDQIKNSAKPVSN